MAWHVYMLRCADGSLYTGITTDLQARLTAHNAGRGAKYTRSHTPVTLAWTARAATEGAAKKREARIKRLTKAEKEQLVHSTRS